VKNQISISPNELLTSDRIDVVAKYLYAKDFLTHKGIVSKWNEQLYLEHIKAFNNFVEGDGSKVSSKDFLDSFKLVLNSIKENGFNFQISSVPISSDGIILDGAHRLAACLVLDKPISVIQENSTGRKYDLAFFLSRGLNKEYCEYLAYEYCKLVNSTRIALLYPNAEGREDQVEELLRRYGKIIYKKQIKFNSIGAVNLVRQVYRNEQWLGNWKNDFRGAQEKAWACFSSNGPLRVFIIETSNLSALSSVKEQIRNIYKIDKHSIHINDSHEETILISKLLLNDNSIHHMNCSKRVYYSWFDSLFHAYENHIKENESENYCIDGSGVLAAYGLRPARDLDYLCLDECYKNELFQDCNIHNEEWERIGIDCREIITDPRKYFYYYGVKVCALSEIYKFKELRGESKDKQDCILINSILNNTNNYWIDNNVKIRSFDLFGHKIKVILKNLIPPSLLRIILQIRNVLKSVLGYV